MKPLLLAEKGPLDLSRNYLNLKVNEDWEEEKPTV